MKLTNVNSMTVNPVQAQNLLNIYPYERQRSVNQKYVQYYAKMMTDSTWLPGSEMAIAFAPNGDGKKSGHLVNGRHRLLAVIASGVPIDFVIREFDCSDDVEVATLYGLIDTGRARNINDHLNALALADEFGLSSRDNMALAAGVVLISANFGHYNKTYLTPPARIELMREYAVAASVYAELIAGSPKRMYIPLRRASTIAVALVAIDEATTVYGDEKVEDFWSGMATDDGLHTTDPRKTANTHLIESNMRGGTGNPRGKMVSAQYSSRYIANCFNAWVQDRQLQFTRVPDATGPILIAGTKYKGR